MLALPLALAFCLLTRVICHEVLTRLRRRDLCLNRLVVIGRKRSVDELICSIRRDTTRRHLVPAGRKPLAGPRLSRRRAFGGSAPPAPIRTPSPPAPTFGNRALRQLGWELEGSNVATLIAPRIADVAGPRIHVRRVGGLPLCM